MRFGRLAALVFAAAATVSTAASAETVYLIAGGFVSCRTSWNPPTDAPVFQAALPRLAPQAYVAACFASDSTTVSFVSDLGEAPVRGPAELLIDAVRMRMQLAEPGSRLVVIGHSYGGWAVLKATIALAEELDVAYLATIDPVSPVGCPPSAYMNEVEPFGPCTETPADLAPGFVTIRESGIPWVNFYQDRYRFLKASPVAEATRNVYLPYPNLSSFWAWQAHALMDGDARVWDEILNDQLLFAW